MNLSRLRGIAAALVLTSCASPDGLRPQGALDDAGRLQASRSLGDLPVSPVHWPATDWWRSLGDERLDALIQSALKGSPSLATADARARLALAQAAGAQAAREPSLSADAGYSGIRIPESLIDPPLGGHYTAIEMLDLKFSYGLDLWGGKRAAWEAALGRARAADVEARAARLALSANVARAYADFAAACELVDISGRELERSQRTLELTQQRVDAGIDAQLQLQQAQGAVSVAQREIEAAGEQVEASRLALAALLGAGPDRGLELERPGSLHAEALALPSQLPAELLGRRPDIVAARWRVEAASQGIQVAQARFYPNVNLSASLGLISMGLGDLAKADSLYYQLAPAVSLPLFYSGALRAGLAVQDAEYDLAVAQYNELLVTALNEVAARIVSLRSTARQMEVQTRVLKVATQAQDLALQRYSSGVGSYLEVLTVQQRLLEAEQTMAALKARQLSGSIQLVQALGGGFGAEDRSSAALPQHPAS